MPKQAKQTSFISIKTKKILVAVLGLYLLVESASFTIGLVAQYTSPYTSGFSQYTVLNFARALQPILFFIIGYVLSQKYDLKIDKLVSSVLYAYTAYMAGSSVMYLFYRLLSPVAPNADMQVWINAFPLIIVFLLLIGYVMYERVGKQSAAAVHFRLVISTYVAAMFTLLSLLLVDFRLLTTSPAQILQNFGAPALVGVFMIILYLNLGYVKNTKDRIAKALTYPLIIGAAFMAVISGLFIALSRLPVVSTVLDYYPIIIAALTLIVYVALVVWNRRRKVL